MLKSLSSRLVLTAAFALAGTSASAAPFAIDTANPSNGLTNLHSFTFDGSLTACGGGSPSYCSFFGGDDPPSTNLTIAPNPSGVVNGVPGGFAVPPIAGSFLDLTLTGGNTSLTLAGGTVRFGPAVITIVPAATVVTTSGAGMVLNSAPQVAAVNGSGQAEFLIDLAPGLAADFSTLGAVVTGCAGPACASLGAFSFDMLRYRLFVDWDPTFTSFTADFIGQTNNNSLVFATLNSGNPATLIPVPAAVWLMGSALGLLGWIRRKSVA